MISFDDGPDPQWTPKILDVLKRYNVKATFFIIGLEAEKYPGLLKRVYREGHEIGNHTFTHPDISNISAQYARVELNLTERLMAAKLGIKPVLFRPPYSVDQEPDTADEVRPLELTQSMGYITVGDKIDPDDWRDDPRPSPEQITQVGHGPARTRLDHPAARWRRQPRQHRESAAHDHRGLHARGYQIVSVHELLGKSYADVMPPISRNERVVGDGRFGWLSDLRSGEHLHRFRLLRRRRSDEWTPRAAWERRRSSTVCGVTPRRWPRANPPSNRRLRY